MPTVRKIPATVTFPETTPTVVQARRKVAAYARVSTDRDEQFTSYEAQIDYYTRFIKSHEDWDFVGVYTDEGITGTSTKHREGFKRMIADALDGKIDLIVTKSVSRFARNTVDSLTTIRQLKEHGTECFFEKENIWTFDGKGELLITIMSSLAQEESRSISENVTWGHRKRMSDGRVSIAFSTFLGYKRGENGEMVIDEGQAEIVKSIYAWFLQGLTPHTIARQLTEMGVPSCCGGNKWYESTVRHILTNEKYKGDALMQKCYTEDFLTKKRLVNKGVLPQYYVEGDHEAIIDPEVFDLVQREFIRRKEADNRYSGTNLFASRIICGECGCYFGPKVWHSNTKYRKTIYLCNGKYRRTSRGTASRSGGKSGGKGSGKGAGKNGRKGGSGGKKCNSPYLCEEEIQQAFIAAVNKLIDSRDETPYALKQDVGDMFDTQKLEEERDRLAAEAEELAEQMEAAIQENASVALDQEEYAQRYHELAARYASIKPQYDVVVACISDKKASRVTSRQVVSALRKISGPVKEFDADLWTALLDHMTVYSKEDIRCTFKDGTEVQV